MVRIKIGQVYKSKDPAKSNYLKIDLRDKASVTLNNGQYVQVESKAYQLASLARAEAGGKLTAENAEAARERINKMPDFVLGELILLQD